MKKILKSIIFSFIFLLGLSSCGLLNKEDHTHTYGPYQSNEQGHFNVCTECGESNTIAPHNFESEVIKEATCSEEGKTKLTCTVCGYSKETAIPTLTHTLVNVPQELATCTTEGHKQHYECSVCHKLFNSTLEEVSEEDILIAKSGHSYGNLVEAKAPTCVEDGNIEHYKCATCNKYFNKEKVEIDASTISIPHSEEYHNYVDIPYLAPTCTTPGYDACKQCTYCENVIGQSTIPAVGHLLGNVYYEWASNYVVCYACKDCTREGCDYVEKVSQVATSRILTEPTCLETGSKEYTADFEAPYEQQVTTVILPAKGHVYTSLIAQENPTCDKQGMKAHYECENCQLFFIKDGNEYKEEIQDNLILEMLPHASMRHIQALEATCTEGGYLDCYYCDDCKTYYKDELGEETWEESPVLDPLGHSNITKVDGIANTCEDGGNIEYYICGVCHKLYSDEDMKNEVTLEETVLNAKGHSYNGTEIKLVSAIGNIYDNDELYMVAKVGDIYYGISADSTGMLKGEVLVKNGSNLVGKKIYPFYTVASIKNVGNNIYGLYAQNAYKPNGVYISSSGSNDGCQYYEDSTAYNSCSWVIEMDSKGLVTMYAKGTNAAKYWAFNTSTLKFGTATEYSSTRVQFYFYKKVKSDIHEVKTANGYETYYTCKDCGCNYISSGLKVVVTSSYDLVTSAAPLKINDKFIIANYNSSIAFGSDASSVSLTNKVSNKSIKDISGLQIFTLRPGYKNGSSRLYKNGTYMNIVSVNTSSNAASYYFLNSSYQANRNVCVTYGSFDTSVNSSGIYTFINSLGSDRTYNCIGVSGSTFKLLDYYTTADNSNRLQVYRLTHTIKDFAGDIIPEQAPTCENIGLLTHYYKDGVYYDEDHKVVNYEDLIIPAIGHSYGEFEYLFGTDGHQKVCEHDETHVIFEKCTFVNGTCSVCGVKQADIHIHNYNVKDMSNTDTLISEKTCTNYATYYYLCSCGAIGTTTYEDVQGGLKAHNLKTESKEATCTSDGYTNKIYCLDCSYVKTSGTAVAALGHDYDIGVFKFNDIDAYADDRGVWTYTCSRCKKENKVNGDTTTRAGSSNYAFKQMTAARYYNGTTFKLNSNGDTFATFNLGKYGQYFYKQLFLECEKVLHSNTDFTSGYFARIKMPSIKKENIPDGVTNGNVGSFLRTICEWFKSDHPEYYFLSADKYTYGASTTSTAKSYFYEPYMYQAFWKASKRQTYQAQFADFVNTYDGYFEQRYADEQIRASQIFKFVMGLITYTTNDEGATAANSIMAILDGKGVCESYALAMMYVGRMNGMNFHEGGSTTHAWVVGSINDKWYQFDPTWADGKTSVSSINRYFGWLKPSDVDSGTDHNIKGTWIPFPAMATTKISYKLS